MPTMKLNKTINKFNEIKINSECLMLQLMEKNYEFFSSNFKRDCQYEATTLK